jgi:ligand-binding sensor domain-containing protein
VATDSGISVYKNDQWINYTSADGLPSDLVYKLALDGSGAVWASTYGGMAIFNGSGFESIDGPFGNTIIGEDMTSTGDGSVWMAAGNILYRYQIDSENWEQWNLLELFSATSVYINEIKTSSGEIWVKARVRDAEANLFNGLLNYNGGFITYTEQEIPGLYGLDTTPVIPGRGDGETAYFACEMGYMTFNYNTGTWRHRVVEIDNHRLPGTIYSMVKDKNGNLWAGTKYGISMYDVNFQKWNNYCTTPGNEFIFDVKRIDFDGQNSIYGYSPHLDPWGGIVKIDIESGNMETILFTREMRELTYDDSRMAVDTLGRIWIGYMYLYYYDGQSQWHKHPDVNIIRCMIKDISGGIWLGSVFYQGDNSQFHLLHIK